MEKEALSHRELFLGISVHQDPDSQPVFLMSIAFPIKSEPKKSRRLRSTIRRMIGWIVFSAPDVQSSTRLGD
jgi:hypothetical protein